MWKRSFLTLVSMFLGSWVGAEVVAAERFDYVGAFSDGTKIGGRELRNPHDAPGAWNLDGKPLFDSDKPLRWLRNHKLPDVPLPSNFVEFRNGDLLPCEVSHYSDPATAAQKHEPVEPTLVVSTTITPGDVPNATRHNREGALKRGVGFRALRLDVEQIRRIVWERRGAELFTPKTVYFRDGKVMSFRSLRWDVDSIKILTEEGSQVVPFSAIAELHLESADAWTEYARQVAALMPEMFGRLVQVETEEGGRITAAAERFQLPAVLPHGARREVNGYRYVMQAFQPTWSLDVVWLEISKVRLRRYFLPHEVPLSAIAPSASRLSTGLARSWRPRVDINVQGGNLVAAGAEYGWGFGVQASSQLEFDLPPIAKSFRTIVGLDQAAGARGCAKGAVFLNDTRGGPLFQSAVFVGSKEVSDSGMLTLPDYGKPNRKLILLADPMLKGAPAGADPLEIGDVLDWLEPVVYLDPQALAEEVARHVEQLKKSKPPATPENDPLWQSRQQFRQAFAKIAPEFGPGQPGMRQNIRGAPGAAGTTVELIPAVPFFPQVARRITTIPSGKVTKLRIEGNNHHYNNNKQDPTGAIVVVNGKQLSKMIFDVPKDKWEFREVDLTPFAGQRVAIEINIDTRMQSMNFRAIEIVSSDPPSEPKPDEKKPDDKKPGEKK